MPSRYAIAVLPFTNMSPDRENEYFSDGISEEILNALTRIEGLHVTARTSSFAFKNLNMDVREIGKKLGVSLILEGSIRKSGNMVRITAQLVKASDGFHLWTETWDRELRGIFIVQDEIATTIAERINTGLVPERKAGTFHTVENLDALDYYLRANYLMHTWDFSQGENMIAGFEKAIGMDPGFTQAYVGLSHCYTWLGSTGHVPPMEAHQRVEEHVAKILSLDPELPDTYAIIAGKNFWIEWDIALALKNIEKALEIKPSFADALSYRGLFLAAAGHIEEALDSLFKAQRLNPLSNQVNYTIGLIYNFTGESRKSLEYTDRNIEISPDWDAQYLTRLESLCRLERFEEAREVIRMVEKDPDTPLSVKELQAWYHASRGEQHLARELVPELEKELVGIPVQAAPSPYFLGSIHLMLGDADKALEYLEMGFQYGATPFLFIRIDTLWDPLRDHPRFQRAVRKIRYPSPGSVRVIPAGKYRRTALDPERAGMLEKSLTRMMQEQKPWLDPGLNASDLAEMLDISGHTLSHLLNEYMGKNFYDYTNAFRLDHFLEIASRPGNRNFTLLALAYESGFNSKTTFNSFFKRILGTTPSGYFKDKDG